MQKAIAIPIFAGSLALRGLVNALPVAAALSLAACAGGVPPVVQQDVTAFINSVRSAVVAGCSFLPTIESVAAVLAAYGPAGTVIVPVEAVAKVICDAVNATPATTASARRRGLPLPVVTINNKQIVIHGTRV
jgi:hypothetical protein